MASNLSSGVRVCQFGSRASLAASLGVIVLHRNAVDVPPQCGLPQMSVDLCAVSMKRSSLGVVT